MASWERVRTGMTKICWSEERKCEVAHQTTEAGNTYRIEADKNPFWETADHRLGVHRLQDSDDWLIAKTVGGITIPIVGPHLGHKIFVKLAAVGTPEMEEALALINGKQVQGY